MRSRYSPRKSSKCYVHSVDVHFQMLQRLATSTSRLPHSADTSSTRQTRVGEPSPAATKNSKRSPRDGELPNYSFAVINDECEHSTFRRRRQPSRTDAKILCEHSAFSRRT